jgi:hypothetical protein
MNIMWIPLLAGSQRPAPAGSERRPMRPMNFAQSEEAISSSDARVDPRVRFRA